MGCREKLFHTRGGRGDSLNFIANQAKWNLQQLLDLINMVMMVKELLRALDSYREESRVVVQGYEFR
jgi:hypothetical protein